MTMTYPNKRMVYLVGPPPTRICLQAPFPKLSSSLHISKETLTSRIPERSGPLLGICMLSIPTPGTHMPDTHLLGHAESADSQIKPVFGYTQQKPILADLSREGRNLLEKIGWC